MDLCVVNKSFMMIYELNDIALKCYNNNNDNVMMQFYFAFIIHTFDGR